MPPKPALDRAASYSIAWIAALAHERAAALVLLDERHEKPKDFTKSDSDQNSYSWGRIGDHNLVIASLPAGEYGEVSAADTASGLRASLPHIRIGLLVGIGAGFTGEHLGEDGNIAIKREILLGDVVVSIPDGTNGGVVQHDIYKAKLEAHNQAYERKGFLNASPRALRNAVSALQAEHELEDSQIEEYLQAFERNTKMKAPYAFPGPDKDRIRRLLHRKTHRDVRTQPAIHYGTIASGNTLVKNTAERDAILARLERENVHPLCLEMEAAGIMNNFPCIVIRGVCDYADEHKNDEWQRYAAATAAAFAKELLTYVDSAEVNKERALGEVLDNIHHDVLQVKFDTTKVRALLSASERREILSWLCPVDYAQLYNTYSKACVKNTGRWHLERSEFKGWLSSKDSSVLYCPGPPGAGKTFLATRIIEFLFTVVEALPKAAVTYMYCDYSRHREQNVAHFLSCLLRQLAHAADTVPQSVQELHTKYSKLNTRPMNSELLKALRTVVTDEFEVVYLVVDALDECDSRTRSTLITHLRDIAEDGKLRILVTSRLIPEIDDLFCQDMHLCLEADGQDIREYVRARTAEIQEQLLFPKDVFDHIVGTIAPAVRGMFLLARLHMDTLKSKTNARDIADALLSLPDGYNGAYEAAMTRINNQDEGHRSLAKQVLMWVVCAKRPLLATELQHAIAIRSGDKVLRSDGLTRIGLLVAVCAGLVALRDNSLEAEWGVKTGVIVHLAHYTAQEYFDRARDNWFPKAELAMSLSCLSYLTLGEFETGPCDSNEQLDERLKLYPFLEYAAKSWGLHAAKVNTDGDSNEWKVLLGAVAPFLQCPSLCDATIQTQGLTSRFVVRAAAYTPTRSTACHLFARFGLGQLCDYCHRVGIDVLALDSQGQSPFFYAITACPKSNADTLLSWSRQTELAKYGSWALWYTVRHGEYESIATLLGSASIDPNIRMYRKTPLIWAAESGHTRTVQILLGCPAVNINAVSNDGETALLRAVQYGRSDPHGMVDAILSAGDVLVDCCDIHDSTPLWHACERGYTRTVKLLIEKGSACVNKQSKDGSTPWTIAASCGHKAVIEALLDLNAPALNSIDAKGVSALCYAAKYGHVGWLNLLLKLPGTDINASDWFGETALMAAAANGLDDIVSLLLAIIGIDVNCQDTVGGTALLHACRRSSLCTARILCEHESVDINLPNDKNETPLMRAVILGNIDLMMYLAGCDFIDVNMKDVRGRTALWHACKRRHWSVALTLAEKNPINLYAFDLKGYSPLTMIDEITGHGILDSGLVTDVALVHRRNSFGYNTFHMALHSGNVALTEWLLRIEQLDVDSGNRHDDTGLLLSAKRGQTNTVKMLLQTMAVNLNASGSNGWRPLSKAAAEGHLEVVKCLLDDTFSVGAFQLNQTSRNMALAYAAGHGKEEIVKYLLTRVDIVFAHWKNDARSPLTLAIRNGHTNICKMLAAEMKRCDPDRFEDSLKWTCAQVGANYHDEFSTTNTMIDLVHALGYTEFAAYCRELDSEQVPCVLRLWGPYSSCYLCDALDLANCWCCVVCQELTCHDCVEYGLWCHDHDHDLLEIKANWYPSVPRFTGLRRSFNRRIAKRVGYWQGQIHCDICNHDVFDGFHCRVCLDDHFDICKSCVVEDEEWCYSHEHSLKTLKRISSNTPQQCRPLWTVFSPTVGANLAGADVHNIFTTGAKCCFVCEADMTRGYWCELCDDTSAICFKCTKDGHWCDDRPHLLQEYDNDAISYPWRSYEEIRSPRRKSFDGQCRFPCDKPARGRRYSFSDVGEVPYDKPWPFERWAGRQLPFAATSDADSKTQDARGLISEDDQRNIIMERNKYRPEWEKWWSGGNFSNAHYDSCCNQGQSARFHSSDGSDKGNDEDSEEGSEK